MLALGGRRLSGDKPSSPEISDGFVSGLWVVESRHFGQSLLGARTRIDRQAAAREETRWTPRSPLEKPRLFHLGSHPRISKWASVGFNPSPLIGSISCGQAEKATRQSISACNVTKLPGVLIGGRTSIEWPSTTGIFMKRLSGEGVSGA